MQLAAGRHVAAQALVGEHAQDRGAGERLRGEHDLARPAVRVGQNRREGARGGTQVRLGDERQLHPAG